MILTFFETQDSALKKNAISIASYCCETKEKFNKDIIGVVANDINYESEQKLRKFGISKLYKINKDYKNKFNCISECISDIAKKENIKILILSHTYIGKYIIPNLSIKLNYDCVSNVNEIPKNVTPFEINRNAFSGKAFENIQYNNESVIISVNTNSYILKEFKHDKEFETIDYDFKCENNLKFDVLNIKKENNKINLTDADIVISGGRGLKGPENWTMIEELAKLLNAATACSKPVSDLKWRPHSEHVGQTGKTISPELYIAIGISGAIQHVAGISSSKYILAINTDQEAPIFKVANYGIVGDAFEIIPKIIEEIKKQ